MQFPNESKDLFILQPSLSLFPLFSIAFSLPAKSTKCSFGEKHLLMPSFECFWSISNYSWIIACDLELNWFIFVLAITLFLFPCSIRDYICSKLSISFSHRSGQYTPFLASSNTERLS